MDRKIANNMIVGVIVTVGFLGFLFIIFNLGGGAGLFSRTYPLLVRFKQVKGLHYGSEVSLAGLRVGVVRGITVAKDNPKELVVELAISKDHQDRIREDSVAALRTQGVLGDKYVELTLGSPEFPALKPGSPIRSEDQEDIFTKSGNLVSEVKRHFEKGGDVDVLLKNVSALVINLNSLALAVRQEKSLLHEVFYGESGKKLASATTHLSEVLRKVDQGEGSLGALLNDPTVYEDIKTLFGGAKRSSILRYFMRSFMDSGKEAKTTDGKKSGTGE